MLSRPPGALPSEARTFASVLPASKPLPPPVELLLEIGAKWVSPSLTYLAVSARAAPMIV
jgi:hypothetical protein